MGFSGSKNLQELSSRVHPVLCELSLPHYLYLTIGPFFAMPRTGAVSFEIGVLPFIDPAHARVGLLIFTIIFFGLRYYFH